MEKLSTRILILLVLISLTIYSATEVSAQCGEAKFRGVAVTNEEWGDFVCYGSYYCNVTVGLILSDPSNTLSLGDFVIVCYDEPLSVKIGDYVECYGYHFKDCVCEYQYYGRVVCLEDPFYVIPEFPSFLLLPLFMIITLLAVIVYRRKHSM